MEPETIMKASLALSQNLIDCGKLREEDRHSFELGYWVQSYRDLWDKVKHLQCVQSSGQ